MKFTPYRIAVIYFVFALGWILLTDQLVAFLAEDVQNYVYYQTVKGIFYITFTAAMLYVMVKSYESYIQKEQAKRDERTRSFNHALNSAHIAIWEYFVGTDRYITSPIYNEIFGMEKDAEFSFENIYSAVLEEDLDRFKQAVEDTLTNHKEFNLEYRTKSPDGSVRWLWSKAVVNGANTPQEKVSGVTIDITEKKELEEKLELEEEKLEKLFGKIPVMITIYDPSIKVTSVNNEFERTLGWTKQDLEKNNIMELCYPDPGYRENVAHFMKLPDSGWKEFEVRSKGGEIRKQLWTNITLADNTMVGIGHDVTEQKLKEQDLREKEYLLSESQRVANLGTYIIRPSTGEENPSKILSRIFGAPEGEDINLEKWEKAVHPDFKQVIKKFYNAVENGEPYVGEYKIIRVSDGETRWVYEKAEPVLDPSGNSEAMIGTVQDITERKNQEKLLEDQRDKLLTAQETARLGYWILNFKTNCFEWSKMAFHLVGRDPDLGEPDYDEFINEIVHPEDKKIVEASQKQCLENGSAEIVYRAIKTNGEIVYFQRNLDLIYDSNGNKAGFSGTVLDITKLKKTEQELKAEQRRFEIAANISSDVIWEWNPGKKGVWWGEGIEFVFGYKKEDYRKHGFWQSKIFAEDKDRVIKSIKDAENSNALKWDEEYRFLAADGDVRHVKDSAVIQRGEEGNVIRIIGAMVDVTDIIQYQQTLQRERKRFEMIAKSSNDVLYEWNIDTNEVWWSEGWQTSFGFLEQEVEFTLEWWEKRLHPDDRDKVAKNLKLAAKTGESSWDEQYRFLNAGNKYSVLLDRGFFIKDKDGKNEYMAGTISDITAKVKAEEKLKASEEQYRLLFEQSPISKWIFDKETLHFITANNLAIKKYGYSKDELQKMKVYHLHPEEDWEAVKKEISESLKKEHTGFDACRHKTKNGEELVVEISGSDIFYRGKVCRLIIGNDVTERNKAEERLKASEEQYRLLFEQNPISMWIYDPDTYEFKETNKAARKKYGYSEKEFTEMTILDIRPKGDAEAVKKDVAKHRGRDETSFSEWTHLTKKGEELIVEISGSDIFYKDKMRRLIIANDITEQKKAEKRAINAIIEGEERERQRIAKELHDGLGQYLSAANMNLETVYEDMPGLVENLKDSFKNGLEFLRRAISETRTISQNLLPKAIQDYGLELAIEALVDQLRNTNKEIQFYLYRNLNGIEIPAKIQINLYRIAQEALNNAIRHGEPKDIDVQLVYSEDEILLSIEDNGSGFKNDKISGSGIGLRSIQTRVGAMSANLDIVSTIGRGTIISAVIPLKRK